MKTQLILTNGYTLTVESDRPLGLKKGDVIQLEIPNEDKDERFSIIDGIDLEIRDIIPLK